MMTSPSTVRAPLSPVNPLPFAALPHELLADRRLIPTDVVLIGHLLRYCRGKTSCWPSVATLASDLGRCRRTVQYSLARLEAAGWITFQSDGNPTGRLIVMAWRVQPACTPPVQAYSQGLPKLGSKFVAPEPRAKMEQRRFVPPDQTPITELECRELFSSWLSMPPGHHLRVLAEKRIAALLNA